MLACTSNITKEEEMTPDPPQSETDLADIVSVTTTGEENGYQFAVGISSPDVNCDQYANWWEIVSQDGNLLYRRILAHSHPTEQPFVRSGGPVEIASDEMVIIRAHMHPGAMGASRTKAR